MTGRLKAYFVCVHGVAILVLGLGAAHWNDYRAGAGLRALGIKLSHPSASVIELSTRDDKIFIGVMATDGKLESLVCHPPTSSLTWHFHEVEGRTGWRLSVDDFQVDPPTTIRYTDDNVDGLPETRWTPSPMSEDRVRQTLRDDAWE